MMSGLLRASVASAALLSTSAFAQTTASQQPPTGSAPTTASSSTVPADAGADGSETIIVTGSRIRRPNFDSYEPITTVSERYVEERNLTNIADALNELPTFRGSVTPNGAQGSFGQGVNFVNAFGLGSNRTLTLVNGRRFVSSNVPTLFNQGSSGTQVDLNVIPTILTDRIETISVGGAPTYGSDAIAGTVNVIVKTRFSGIQVSGTTEITEVGDRFRYNVAFAGGINFAQDRGNISASYSRERVAGVAYNSRGFLRENIGNVTNPSTAQAATLGRPAGTTFANDGRVNPTIGFNDTTTDNIPGTVLARDVTIPFLTGGGLITTASGPNAAAVARSWQFDRSGNLVPFNRGIAFVGINASGGDGFRFNDYLQLTSNLERDIFNGFLNFEVSPALKFFAEATYFRSRGDELIQQPSFNSSLFGGLSGALTFDTTSPFLTAQARTQLQALGVTTFSVSRASLDLADLTGFSSNRLYRGVLGAQGDFKLGERDFNYEISGVYGRTDITDTRQDLNAQRFINAVNVATVNGQTVCTITPLRQAAPGGTPSADPACVPLNLLGEGLSSQASRDYVISTNVTKSFLEQIVFNANIGGSPFDIFGNKVALNAGYEYREERGGFTPSAFEQQGLGRAVAIAPVSGKFNVNELFGEVLVPVVSPQNDLPFLNRLEVFARGRYVKNTVNGGFFSWAVGGTIAPIRDIQFRGNFTRSFRAPAITELFLPVSNSFVTVPDLCSPGNRNGGAAPTVRARNCAAFLTAFPNSTPLDAASATVPGRSGGNASLRNEVANSFTYGIVLKPRFIPGLSISADYIRIKINDPIANLTVAQIASACFDNETFNTSDPANGNQFCSQIRRYTAGQGGTAVNGGDRGGQVVNDAANPGVSSGFVNGKQVYFSGIQGSIDYTHKLDDIGLPGALEITGDVLFVDYRLNDITGVAPINSDGVIGDPKFSGQLNVRYIGEEFGLTTSFNYVGKQLFARTVRTLDQRELDTLSSYATMNLSTYVDVDKKFRLTLAVTNVFNRQGEYYNGVIIPASYNDLFGRRFSVTARARF